MGKRKVDFTNEDINAFSLRYVEAAAQVLESKGTDYGWDNFEKSAKIASVITGKEITAVDVAACLIGIKCARYGNLTINNFEPLNESVADTVIDAINYFALMERERQRILWKAQQSSESLQTQDE